MDKCKAFRLDAIDKVTGRAKYGADYYDPTMVYGKILWSPVPRAKIRKIDTNEAEKAPGVVGIVTRKDITGLNLTGVFQEPDRPILVGEGEECRFRGDALALIAAETEDQADRARDLIRVEYEEIPVAFTVAEAKARGDEPLIYREVKKGDVEAGFRDAAVIVEREYSIPYQEHSYIEPEGGFAFVDEFGVVTVVEGTQDVTANHRAVSRALGLPFNKLRMHAPYVGGAFGGKHLLTVQPYLALMALVLKRPVHITWTREESIAFSCKKQNTAGKIRLGLDQDGKICALAGHIDGPSAPYLGNSGDNCNGVLGGMVGPYRYPNIDLTGNMWVTTDPENGAFRSVGAADGVQVIENLLTEAGAKLGLSQLEVRKRNWVKTVEELKELPVGPLLQNSAPDWPMEKLMDMALEEAGDLPAPRSGKRVGRGLASAKPAYATRNTDHHSGSVVEMHMYLDGSVDIRSGFEELGQGLTGVITTVASEALGIPEEKVSAILSDSHHTPPAGALGFSQATVSVGNAIIMAAESMKRELCRRAGELLETAEPLTFRNYQFCSLTGEVLLEWKPFSDYCFAQVDYLAVKSRDRGPKGDHNKFSVTPMVCVADIEVDEETGEICVLQIVHCHDIGRVLHEKSARGQVIGGALMTVGGFMMEEFATKNGFPATPSLAQYLIPTAMDIPVKQKVIFYEGNPAPDCPFGAKGLGEHGCYCPGAAIGNALFDAIGVSIMDFPVTPEKVLRAMGKI